MRAADRCILAVMNDDVQRAKFLSRVERRSSDECWPWIGSTNPKGYGTVTVRGMSCAAHRLAYVLANGELPSGTGYHGTVIMHTCDNPPCCNPAHLVPGTILENNRDRERKGRSADWRGSRHPRARLSEADVVEIRRLRSGGVKCKDIAIRFKISEPYVSNVALGRFCWRHV